jgi:nicotinamidase-related amidase
MPSRSSARAIDRKVASGTGVPRSRKVLLLVDFITPLRFEGAGDIADAAVEAARATARLRKQFHADGSCVIYVNDNFGQWRSDFRKTVAHCTAKASKGRHVSTRMRPTEDDFFVLKPKHSGFYDTTLETLLDDLKISRVIVTGIAGNICVLFTANDAYMRGLKIFAPADCIVSNTAADNESALRQIELVLKGDVTPSTLLRFRPISS